MNKRFSDIFLEDADPNSLMNYIRRMKSNVEQVGNSFADINIIDILPSEITEIFNSVSGLGYTLKFEDGDLICALLPSSTVYIGAHHLGLGSIPDGEINPIVVPKAGTLKRVDMYYLNLGTLTSGEDAVIDVWKNSITTIATWDNDCGFDEIYKHHAITDLNATLVEGDTISVKITTPSWSPYPTSGIFVSATLYIE